MAVGARRQSLANRVFFSNGFSLEISVLIYPLKECEMFIPGFFLLYKGRLKKESIPHLVSKRAESLRQSILKKAFSGKLDPKETNDELESELLNRTVAGKLTITGVGNE